MQSGDARKVAFAAHKLKGSAATVGAEAMTSLCAQVEQLAQAGSSDGLDELIQRLDVASSAVRAALQQAGDTRAPPTYLAPTDCRTGDAANPGR